MYKELFQLNYETNNPIKTWSSQNKCNLRKDCFFPKCLLSVFDFNIISFS